MEYYHLVNSRNDNCDQDDEYRQDKHRRQHLPQGESTQEERRGKRERGAYREVVGEQLHGIAGSRAALEAFGVEYHGEIREVESQDADQGIGLHCLGEVLHSADGGSHQGGDERIEQESQNEYHQDKHEGQRTYRAEAAGKRLGYFSVLPGLRRRILHYPHDVAADAEGRGCGKGSRSQSGNDQELRNGYQAHRQHLADDHRQGAHRGKQKLHDPGGLFRCDGLRHRLTVGEDEYEQNQREHYRHNVVYRGFQHAPLVGACLYLGGGIVPLGGGEVLRLHAEVEHVAVFQQRHHYSGNRINGIPVSVGGIERFDAVSRHSTVTFICGHRHKHLPGFRAGKAVDSRGDILRALRQGESHLLKPGEVVVCERPGAVCHIYL